MERSPTFDLFSLRGSPARAKIVVLGSTPSGSRDPLCSLNLEHVSPALLVRSEISRPASADNAVSPAFHDGSTVLEKAAITAMRRWFWTRKPDAGFVLRGFPATLLQAMMLDEWLDARGESLSAVVEIAPADPDLVMHYRTLGCEFITADVLHN